MADNAFEKGIRRRLNQVPRVERLAGTFVQADGLRGTVDCGGGRIPADLSGYLPAVGESVWVLIVKDTATVLGPTQLKPDRGTVTAAPAGNNVAISTGVGNFLLPYAAGLSLSVGQIVKLLWQGEQGYVLSVMSTSPTPAAPPPAPPTSGGNGSGDQVFAAIDAGSYNARWWTNQIYASDANTGAWFYGTKIADTIPDGATVTSIDIWISIASLSYQAPVFGLHSSGTKPGGNVALGSLTPFNISNGWLSLPTSWGDFLKTNVGGVGINHGGFAILNALAADAQSGALRIRWRS